MSECCRGYVRRCGRTARRCDGLAAQRGGLAQWPHSVTGRSLPHEPAGALTARRSRRSSARWTPWRRREAVRRTSGAAVLRGVRGHERCAGPGRSGARGGTRRRAPADGARRAGQVRPAPGAAADERRHGGRGREQAAGKARGEPGAGCWCCGGRQRATRSAPCQTRRLAGAPRPTGHARRRHVSGTAWERPAVQRACFCLLALVDEQWLEARV
jgi:hypothetical protein